MITSRHNKTFKYIFKIIKNKKFRQEEGVYWIEGANFIKKAIENNWETQTLLYSDDKLNTDFRKEVFEEINCEKIEIDEKLLLELSAKNETQGLGALVKKKFLQNEISPGIGLVLENISIPGNLGTIMRTMACFEIRNLYIINPAADPFDFSAVRASMSGIFHLKIHIFENIESIIKQFEIIKKFKNIGLDNSNEAHSIKAFNFESVNPNTLFWLGNEAKGLSDKAKTLCKEKLRIPMSDKMDSLNISEAGTVLMYEMFSQKL